jgi:protein-tyrosine phosphatase
MFDMMTDTPARHLATSTGQNFRDMGGYEMIDGRTLRWRTLFRSGVMSRIDGDDHDELHALGIDTICDFRANGERERHPTHWHVRGATELWVRDYDFSSGNLHQMIQQPGVVASEVHSAMTEIYRHMPFEQAPSFAEMFKRLAAGRVPLVFNCSAGKDRTGIAAALILTVLGASPAVIEADYMLTNDSIEGLSSFLIGDPKYTNLIAERIEHAQPLLRAEPEYLATAFAVMEAEHGSVDGYLQDRLGVTDADRSAIQAHLLV